MQYQKYKKGNKEQLLPYKSKGCSHTALDSCIINGNL